MVARWQENIWLIGKSIKWDDDIQVYTKLSRDAKISLRRSSNMGKQKDYDYDDEFEDDDDCEAINVWDAADIWLSNGMDEDYMFGYTEDELKRALR